MCWRVPLHPSPSACIHGWAEGYQSCPLWQTADKFSWVRLLEGPGEREGVRALLDGYRSALESSCDQVLKQINPQDLCCSEAP